MRRMVGKTSAITIFTAIVCLLFGMVSAHAQLLGEWAGHFPNGSGPTRYDHVMSVPQDGLVTLVTTADSTLLSQYIGIGIFDRNGQKIDVSSYVMRSPSTMHMPLARGTYVVRIGRGLLSLYGNYRIQATLTPANPSATEIEPNDTIAQANTHLSNRFAGAIGHMRTRHDFDKRDYFKFTLSRGTHVQFDVSITQSLVHSQATVLSLRNSNDTQLNYILLSTPHKTWNLYLDPGTYYLRMATHLGPISLGRIGLHGGYTITTTTGPAPRTLTVRSAGAAGVPITANPATYAGTTNYQRANISNNAVILLTAPPARGAAQFRSWTGCASVTGRTCRVVMNANKTVTANYGVATRTLHVRSAGAVNVPITANPWAFRGTTNYTRTNIRHNAVILLTAPPARGAAQFRSWTGCTSVSGRTCRVVMNANKTVTANYGTSRLAAPTPTGPTGTTVPQPLFTWTAVQGAQTYELQIMTIAGHTIQHVRNIRGTSWRRPANLPNGNYRFRVRAAAGTVFSPWSQTLNFTVGPAGRSYIRLITLTWGTTPRDLDLHLKTPTGHHVYYARRGSQASPPYARLDVDHRLGRGPENISIYRFVSSGSRLYRCYVHNYSNERPLAGSGARVSIQDRNRTLRTFVAPGTGSGRYWHVFNMNSAGVIIPVNRIVGAAPASVYAIHGIAEDFYPSKD